MMRRSFHSVPRSQPIWIQAQGFEAHCLVIHSCWRKLSMKPRVHEWILGLHPSLQIPEMSDAVVVASGNYNVLPITSDLSFTLESSVRL